MRRAPIRIRTFLLGTVLVLLLVPTLAGAAAWFIERDHERAGVQGKLNTAVTYLRSHGEMQQKAALHGFTTLLDRLNLLAQLVVATTVPPAKTEIYVSPALAQAQSPSQGRGSRLKGGPQAKAIAAGLPGTSGSWSDDHQALPVGTRKSHAILVADLYYPPASRAPPALAALITGIIVFLAGLAVAVWLAGRWMVAPLARLSAQVDKVAGGDLTIEVPRSRIGEVENIAQAVEGMTAALGETERRRAEADEARRFLITSVAHDLRTPLFALRGHLQAIRTGLGNPAVHLERAEARADALERLVGNLFAYTRDDYAQPTLQLEAAPVAELLEEVTAGLEHTARIRGNAFDLDGDETLGVSIDRDRLKRALTNILDNALRYSPPGDRIHLSWAAVDESAVQITIQDHGPGIDPSLLPHIFEPGIRGAPAAGGSDGGAGLGLTIAKRLLEHQHATLTVNNQPTGGATVSLTLERAPSVVPSSRLPGLR